MTPRVHASRAKKIALGGVQAIHAMLSMASVPPGFERCKRCPRRRTGGDPLPSPLRGGDGGGGPHQDCPGGTPLPDPPPQGGRERSELVAINLPAHHHTRPSAKPRAM